MKPKRSMIRTIRILGLAVVGAWGWYHAAMLRTSGWEEGNAGREILVAFVAFWIFTLPVALLPLIGVSWRRKFIALAVLSCACTLAAEAFARAQETLLIQKVGPRPEHDYTERRWWPFEHHSLGIINGQRWGCD